MVAADPEPRPEALALGRSVRMHRVARGWRQADLARRCGVAQSLISTWESGRRRPDLDQVLRLAMALDVPVLQLVEGHATLTETPAGVLAELRWYGLDLAGAKAPLWAVRPAEEILPAALVDPRPRVIDRLPALFFLQPSLDGGLLHAHARRRDVVLRLGWLADVARALVRRGTGAQTRALAALTLEPDSRRSWDSLGYPAVSRNRLPPIWKRWKIDYDRDLTGVEEAVSAVLTAAHHAR